METSPSEISEQKRHLILKKAIQGYLDQGYKVIGQGLTSAELTKEKEFSCLIGALGLAALGIGLLIYLFYLKGLDNQRIFIEVDPDRRVHERTETHKDTRS